MIAGCSCRSAKDNESRRVAISSAKQLNPRFTFDSFIVGSGNEIAHAAAIAVAEGKSPIYNPFFVHGLTGTGKTHLLHAIAHGTQGRCPTAEIRYITAEDFTNAMRTYIQQERMDAFRQGIRKIDMLLVDDLQYLQTRRWTHGEFLHTFNALHESGKQVVIAGNRSLDELEGFDTAPRDRLQSGLVAEIEPPNEEIKIKILLRRAADADFDLPLEIAELLASHLEGGPREILGALTKLIAYRAVKNEPLTVALTKQLIDFGRPRLSFDSILTVVADDFGMKPASLKAKDNSRKTSEPRQIAMYLANQAGISLSEIARQFDKHHTTVLHSVKKIADARKTQKDLDKLLLRLSETIDG